VGRGLSRSSEEIEIISGGRKPLKPSAAELNKLLELH
jgi:hypothetical protein